MYMGLSNFQTLSKAVYLQVATTSDTYVRGMGKSNNNSQDILKTSQRWELTYERERCLLHLELFFFCNQENNCGQLQVDLLWEKKNIHFFMNW